MNPVSESAVIQQTGDVSAATARRHTVHHVFAARTCRCPSTGFSTGRGSTSGMHGFVRSVCRFTADMEGILARAAKPSVITNR